MRIFLSVTVLVGFLALVSSVTDEKLEENPKTLISPEDGLLNLSTMMGNIINKLGIGGKEVNEKGEKDNSVTESQCYNKESQNNDPDDTDCYCNYDRDI